jgi:Dyp-type peroxidase family
MPVNLDDVQGNVLRGYKHMRFATYLFCEFAHEKRPPRELLAHLATRPPATEAEGDDWPHLMNGQPWPARSRKHEALNVALTFRGVKRLGWAEWFDEDRFEAFRQGMLDRCARLGDDRQTWKSELTRDVDLLFIVYADSQALRDAKVTELRSKLERWGLAEVSAQEAAAIVEKGRFAKREHFGFRDGFSQPPVDLEGDRYPGSRRDPVGEGVLRRPWAAGRWRPVRAGEFLLGHRDEDGVIAGDFDAASPHHNGTFMVWRKLEQDVGAFARFVARAAPPGGEGLLKAKLVGRWQDGTSLVDAPWARPPASARTPGNSFSYLEDPQGARCPIGAHVRRANPRESLGYGTERSKRHRIIRRGLPYQEGDVKGLVFVCFNASIDRQFELIQGGWLMGGDALDLGSEEDCLLGRGGPGAMVTIPGDAQSPARFLERGAEQFVIPRGGYYLFLPGLTALKRMAEGPSSGPPVRKPSRTRTLFGITVGIACRRRFEERRAVDDEPHVKLLRKLARLSRQGAHPLGVRHRVTGQ